MPPATILVADDDQPLLLLLKENLELEGYKVLTGFDGKMAIDLAISRVPDLMILDIHMPTASGLDVLTHLRRIPETRSIPILLMSAMPAKSVTPVIDRHRRVAYVRKPLELEHFNNLIREFLAQYPVERKLPAKSRLPPGSPLIQKPH